MKLIRYNGNFVKCKEQIEKAGQKIATARQGMLDRIALGPDSHYKKGGCWHPEGTARIDKINYWLLPEFAPTTRYPNETLEANKNGKYLDLTDRTIVSPKGVPFIELIPEIAEKDKDLPPYKRRVLIPEIQETFSHATASLKEVDIVLFLARDKKLPGDYGNFLNDKCGILFTEFLQIKNDYNDVAAGFWLHRLVHGFDSNFDSSDRYFDDNGGSLFGVAKREALSQNKNSAEPTQKILVYKPDYTQKEIEKYSRILEEVKSGNLPNSRLEKVLTFLNKLKR